MGRIFATLLLTAFAVGAPWAAASAAEYEVQMRNKGTDGQAWQFEPAFLKIAPGDTVTFVSADKGHNSETTELLVPKDGTTWKGKINEPVKVTFDQEGVYAYKCLPHAALGMVGVIQVGNSVANVEAAKNAKIPGKGKTRLAELITQVGN
ncbi:pseudoazurin [Aminobacter ciceronei]|uniref:Pseudoazurin n=1 Tax=Aminobacter ciceronei TaxID=150723 RepID=A0ABR6CHE2_9HYPH|nr:pseudoazurin [Aminobacter ciceronei]MBA8910249.1 pseudoazurin [Aminobacter ciceronei]MBA9024013.1 pseudoazurin [Aminobacter ciceronei]